MARTRQIIGQAMARLARPEITPLGMLALSTFESDPLKIL